MATKKKQLKVTLTSSPISVTPNHKQCVKGLGLRRMHHTVILQDNACIRGLINKVRYLLTVEEV